MLLGRLEGGLIHPGKRQATDPDIQYPTRRPVAGFLPLTNPKPAAFQLRLHGFLRG
jgi:hypothetical protein